MVAVVVCKGSRRIAAGSSHEWDAARPLAVTALQPRRALRRCWVRHDFRRGLDATRRRFGDRIGAPGGYRACGSGIRIPGGVSRALLASVLR